MSCLLFSYFLLIITGLFGFCFECFGGWILVLSVLVGGVGFGLGGLGWVVLG